MTMKIEIEAHDLVEILIEAGIPDIDAKSLVFDILSTQNGIAPKKKPEPEKLIKRPIQRVEPKIEQNLDEEVDDEEEVVESKVKTTRVSYQGNSKSNQAINFSNFGGNFNGMSK